MASRNSCLCASAPWATPPRTCSSLCKRGSSFRQPGRAAPRTRSEPTAEDVMMRGLSFATVALLALPLAAQPRPSPTAVPAAFADTMPRPMDPARAMEAEVRIALNDLFANRTVAALQRLQWLAANSGTLPATPASGSVLRDRGDVLFLLAESQYRLGMDSAFRSNAQAVLTGGPARYA